MSIISQRSIENQRARRDSYEDSSAAERKPTDDEDNKDSLATLVDFAEDRARFPGQILPTFSGPIAPASARSARSAF